MNTRYPDDEEKLAYARKVLQRKARDNTRVPMQWTSETPNAGFCAPETTPWMRINDDYPVFNAAAQVENLGDPSNPSVLTFWKRALAFRRANRNVLVYGDFALMGDLDVDSKVVAYRRSSPAGAFVVILNFSGDIQQWEIPGDVGISEWLVGNYEAGKPVKVVTGFLTLKPWEGILASCKH